MYWCIFRLYFVTPLKRDPDNSNIPPVRQRILYLEFQTQTGKLMHMKIISLYARSLKRLISVQSVLLKIDCFKIITNSVWPFLVGNIDRDSLFCRTI